MGQCFSPGPLSVDACAEPANEVNGRVIGGVTGCALDFGEVSSPTRRDITLTNTGQLSVSVIVDVELPGGTGVVFALAPPVEVSVPAVSTAVVGVVASNISEGPGSAVLRISTDAANLPPSSQGSVAIALTATGP